MLGAEVGTVVLTLKRIKRRFMKRPAIKNIKRAKAIFGLITAAFSLAIAIQQVYHLKKGKISEASA